MKVVSLCSKPRAAKGKGTNLHGAASGDDGAVLDGPPDDLDRIVQTALDLGDELFGATAEDERARAGLGAPFKEVVPLRTDLLLLKDGARP